MCLLGRQVYFAVVTATTVGYGDLKPKTAGGKVPCTAGGPGRLPCGGVLLGCSGSPFSGRFCFPGVLRSGPCFLPVLAYGPTTQIQTLFPTVKGSLCESIVFIAVWLRFRR